jgi:aminoglycoside phosphotransferase (APT) family kinase protein
MKRKRHLTPPARVRYGRLTLSRHQVFTRRPGRRTVLAYRAQRPGRAARFVFAKQFSDASQAVRVHDILDGLRSAAIGAPRPIDISANQALVLYKPVDGAHLSDLILTDRKGWGLRRAADWLAQLHDSSIRLDRSLDPEQEVANLGEWATNVAEAKPRASAAALGLFEELEALAAEMTFAAEVPVHKDFHPGHVIVGEQSASLDVDEMRYGDPSFDLAHFCVHLRLLGLRGRRRMRQLERHFLDSYARRTGWRKDERFVFFSAYTCLKIAKQLCAGSGVEPRPAGAELDRQLSGVLRHGRVLTGGIR